MIVGFAADIAVRRRRLDGLAGGWSLVETRFENVGDGRIAQCIDGQGTLACHFQTIGLVASRQGKHALCGSIPLFRMRAVTQQALDKYRRIAPDFCGFLAQGVRRRVGIALVGLRHMLIDGDVARALRASKISTAR